MKHMYKCMHQYMCINRLSILNREHLLGLLAGIDLPVYGVFLITISLLAIFGYLDEMIYEKSDRDSAWHILNPIIVGGEGLNNRVGSTRKLYSIISGLLVLLFSMYYQSKLLQQLLIPAPIKRATIADVANEISSMKSTLHMFDYMSPELKKSALRELKTALNYNPPIVN